MTRAGQAGSERSFGLSVGTVLVIIAAALVWRGRPLRGEALGTMGIALVFLALVSPSLLKWPNVVWWRLAHVLGYVNARVLLSVLFLIVLVPVGLIWRLTGKDPLGRRRAAWSGWSPYPSRYRDRRHFLRMY